MIAIEEYNKIKDNCCICYFGQSNEYLIILENILSCLKNKFINLNLFFSCKDESYKYFRNKNNVLKFSELKEKKNKFAFIKEIKTSHKSHPLEIFLNECEINIPIIEKSIQERENSEALIITKGSFPTNNLTIKDIQKLVKFAQSKNFNVQIDSDVLKPSMVLGVESVDLVNAAINGIDCYLVPTGLGTDFYKKLFPSIKLI